MYKLNERARAYWEEWTKAVLLRFKKENWTASRDGFQQGYGSTATCAPTSPSDQYDLSYVQPT